MGKTSDKFKIGDKVILKNHWITATVKRPNPTIWEIEDILLRGGYKLKHGNPGRCVGLQGIIYDNELSPAPMMVEREE